MNMDLQGEGWRVFAGSCLDRLRELPDESVDAVVTDPPYGLSNTDPAHVSDALVRWVSGERDFIPEGKGFMGKAWDAFVPPPAVWDECLRVLKPGGHVLAFAGSRTFDLMALSIRLAGFEIRDSVAWLYGSGFPKSLDVSKAIDKTNGEVGRKFKFTEFMRTTGLTAKQLDEVTGTNMGGHYLTAASQPAIPTPDIWALIRPLIDDIPTWVDELVDRVEAEREVVGSTTKARSTSGDSALPTVGGKTIYKTWDETAPATVEAQKWQGWGTALKPAFEPVVVARKPLIGTVAENVLLHGTGGLNIDGTRIGTDARSYEPRLTANANLNDDGWQKIGEQSQAVTVSGRWPSNVMLDEFTAGLVDEQSGVSKSPAGVITQGGKRGGFDIGSIADGSRATPFQGHGDTGGASRFFYVAKASKRDRNEGLENIDGKEIGAKGNGLARTCATCNASVMNGCECPDRTYVNPTRQNFHPTVKPTDLMRQLVRLVTPPGGVVLDPFTGSGSTGKAAILEGFEFVGVELTDEYLPIIEGRLSHAVTQRAQAESEALAQQAETLF
jgi:DNA modification methylase